jgi:8-oxo-dGTP pyrophosphatase MutT (NUDIX family)
VAGAALVDLRATSSSPLLVGGLLVTFGLAFFAFHVWLYFAFMKPGPPRQPARDVHTDVHTDIYPSPGGTSERIHLFLGRVNHRQRAARGGGVAAEGEDVQIVVLPFHQAMDMVERGDIRDAKTIVALQHLALLKAGDGDIGTSS